MVAKEDGGDEGVRDCAVFGFGKECGSYDLRGVDDDGGGFGVCDGSRILGLGIERKGRRLRSEEREMNKSMQWQSRMVELKEDGS
ncbi:hypothetical protein LOK49_LG11G00494 [Camellia lanceoleosa]|uniref:Uncharacterized protein n=1 Tax=Camellia lanceoleosa TaxID=1840588 RepID=A0ACC0G533_9ERIC|nr:hypothetical protein LOK49_LG11G00494 [Camellia lanceoleosa]